MLFVARGQWLVRRFAFGSLGFMVRPMDGSPTLRYGWTTGACAAAATQAAMEGLCSGTVPSAVTITLPKGETPTFPVLDAEVGDGWASAFIEKDAGDDPDVTHGALIGVRVARRESGEPIRFFAGEGVGTVTKPGLPIGVGEPAINPVPRGMILEEVSRVLQRFDADFPIDLTVSVPGGAALAIKTWNPRLGIVGGLSILGTTGIVRPFSCAAWIASIHRGIDVAVASGLTHVVGATGSTSEAAVQRMYDLPEVAYLDMGDFAGGLLKYLRNHPIEKLTIAGGPGKMSKLAQGSLDLHSKRSQVDMAMLAEWCGDERILGANTALEAFEIAGKPLADAVAKRARETALEALRGAPVAVESILVDRAGKVLSCMPFSAAR